MATSPNNDALTDLRGILAAHARDPRARLVQLDKTLDALQAAFDQVELQQRALARACMQIDAAMLRDLRGWEGILSGDYVKLRAIAEKEQ